MGFRAVDPRGFVQFSFLLLSLLGASLAFLGFPENPELHLSQLPWAAPAAVNAEGLLPGSDKDQVAERRQDL